MAINCNQYDGVQCSPRNLHSQCHPLSVLPVHSKGTFTAIEGEERHGALTNSQGTRRPGGRRGKERVHLRESGLQGGGPGGVPPFVSGAAHSRRGGAAVALCPSLVGCKGQHCSAAWQVLLWLLQLHRWPLHTCVAVYMGSTRVRHRMRTMACHTGLQVQHVLQCLATCLATRALPLPLQVHT